jgi:phospholipid/cholesterol/gamma-HCH transport system substrate-binding protein
MDTHSEKFKVRLGAFIAGGLILFILAVFVIGKQKNLFNPEFKLSAVFSNVSGLQVGNNIRFAGINVGIVDNIKIINDTAVRVNMLIRKNVKEFIKTDCQVGIGSEGLIGDRLITITEGSADAPEVKDGQELVSSEPVETDAIMASLKVTASNAEVISKQLAEIMYKVNNGNGILSKLIQDSTMAGNLDATMLNLRKSTKGLDENMEAAKHNFLLKGYFKKLEKAKEKKAKDAEEGKVETKK